MLKVVENGSLREAGWDLFELDKIALAGARGMLIAALKMEAADYVERHRDELDAEGRALVVHNGKGQARKLTNRSAAGVGAGGGDEIPGEARGPSNVGARVAG